MWEAHIIVPERVQNILAQLNHAGFEAYAVGGCVRDSLRGECPQDWDICTSAMPQETISCFPEDRTVLTGVEYGTVTLVRDQQTYEITTYRTEEGYVDCRHPGQVHFLRELQGDLMRRDFTVNAMAADASGKVVDLFGGMEDLKRGIIRCVGQAEARFSEDALRILRGLRFAARLGFSFSPETAQAIHKLRDNLGFVAPERLQKELNGLLLGKDAPRILEEFADVLCVLIPDLGETIGFYQHNPHHDLDVWGHTLKAMEAAEADVHLRLAVLLHDIGKPATFTLDEAQIGHFYGHEALSAQMTREILQRLRYDKETVRVVTALVEEHGCHLASLTAKGLRRRLARLGEPLFRKLLRLQRADGLGGRTQDPKEVEEAIRQAEENLGTVLAADACLSLRQLAINGKDLQALGIPQGKEIGRILNRLFDAVLEETLPNERAALLEAAKDLDKTDKIM